MNERLTAIVGARITEFQRKMAQVKQIAKTVPNKIVVDVEARIDKFQRKMARLANMIHAFDTVGANMAKGGMMMISPAIVPILASAVGLIGSLGPMIGVLGGSTFALATAFGFAGTAAVAFGAVAIPTITKLFDENTKLTKAQKEAKAEFTKFGDTWKGITKDLEKPVLQAFSTAMQSANKALQMARPLFDSAATAVNNLLTSLNASLDSPPIKAFFDYMNKSAGPMLETLGKAFGNFMQGFMSMMVAFGPLAEQTAQGFLKMSQNFTTWANGLSQSAKFQAFVGYIQENMPKIRAIFRDALAGITYFFAAFGPLSSDMMTSLQNMMARFKEWSRVLGDNQQFQKFIGYIRENAPQVIALIGNLVNFIVNLGVALAPLGAQILILVNGFLSWVNSMMAVHPIIGQIIGVLIILVGSFMALLPTIIAITTLFSGFGTIVAIAMMKLRLVLVTGIKMMIQSLVGFAVQVATTTASIIASFAMMIAQGAVWVARMIAQVAIQIAQWALLGAQALLHAAKVGAAWLVTVGYNAAVALAQMIATAAVFVARWAWMGVQALLHAGKMAAAWFIALGPVGWVIGVIVALVILIIANWDKVKEYTIKAWTAVSTFVSNAARAILGYIQANFPALYNIIQASMQSAQQIITSVWNYIKGTFQNVLAFLKALVKGDFEGMKSAVQNQMNLMKSTISNIWDAIKSFFSSALSTIVSTVKQKFADVVNAIRDKMNDAKSKVQDGINQVKSFLSGIDLSSMGKQMIQGLINGIGSMAGALVDKAKGVVSGAVEGAKALLGIQSPSRVFMEIGQYTGEGMVIGMNRMVSSINKASVNMAKASIVEPQRTQFGFDGIRNNAIVNSLDKDIRAQVAVSGTGRQINVTVNGNGVDIDEKRLVSLLQRTEALYG